MDVWVRDVEGYDLGLVIRRGAMMGFLAEKKIILGLEQS